MTMTPDGGVVTAGRGAKPIRVKVEPRQPGSDATMVGTVLMGTGYRVIGSWKELSDSIKRGFYQSDGGYTVRSVEGRTQFTNDIQEALSWHGGAGRGEEHRPVAIIECNLADLDVRSMMGWIPDYHDVRPDGTVDYYPDTAAGLGVDMPIPLSKIRRVHVIEDGRIVETWTASEWQGKAMGMRTRTAASASDLTRADLGVSSPHGTSERPPLAGRDRRHHGVGSGVDRQDAGGDPRRGRGESASGTGLAQRLSAHVKPVRIEYTKRAEKDIAKMRKGDRKGLERTIAAINNFPDGPQQATMVVGWEPWFRMAVGDSIRVLFRIDNGVMRVAKIGQHEGFYDDLSSRTRIEGAKVPTAREVGQAWVRYFGNAQEIRQAADELLGLEPTPTGVTRPWAAISDIDDPVAYAQVMLDVARQSGAPLPMNGNKFSRPAGTPALVGGTSAVPLYRLLIVTGEDYSRFMDSHRVGSPVALSLAAAAPNRSLVGKMIEIKDYANRSREVTMPDGDYTPVLMIFEPPVPGIGRGSDEFIVSGRFEVTQVRGSEMMPVQLMPRGKSVQGIEITLKTVGGHTASVAPSGPSWTHLWDGHAVPHEASARSVQTSIEDMGDLSLYSFSVSDHGKVVGTLEVEVPDDSSIPATVNVVNVVESHRRQGIASMLMQEMIDLRDRQWPGREIDMGNFTPAGSKWWSGFGGKGHTATSERSCAACGSTRVEITGEAKEGGGYHLRCHGCDSEWDDVSASHEARSAYENSPSSLYDYDVDTGSCTEADVRHSMSQSTQGLYSRERALIRAGMPKGITFNSIEAMQRYAETVMREEGIDWRVKVIDGGVSMSSFCARLKDGTGCGLVMSRIMWDEIYLIHELAHAINFYRVGSGKKVTHGAEFSEIMAHLVWKYMGISLFTGFENVAAYGPDAMRVYEAEGEYRKAHPDPKESLDSLTELLREVLGHFGVRHADEAYAYEDLSRGPDVSYTGWDTEVWTPTVLLGSRMQDRLTLLHEASHHVDMSRRNIMRNTSTEQAHSPQWAQVFLEVLAIYHPEAHDFLASKIRNMASAPRRSGSPFGRTWEQAYKAKPPVLRISVYSGNGFPKERIVEKEIPWKADVRRECMSLTREARDTWTNRPSGGINYKDPTFVLHYVGNQGNDSGYIAMSRSLDGNWATGRVVSGNGFGDFNHDVFQALFGQTDRDVAWRVWANEVANIVDEGEVTHPGISDSDETITVYRGISLDPGHNPTQGRVGEDRTGQMGYSWTTDLDIAKAIAEKGRAGFSLTNRPGEEIYYNDKQYVPTVLRATVRLGDNATLFEGGIGGWKYLQGEREVEIPQGTEFMLTGWMQATAVDVLGATDALGKPTHKVTFRWPSSWHNEKMKRTALDHSYPEGISFELKSVTGMHLLVAKIDGAPAGECGFTIEPADRGPWWSEKRGIYIEHLVASQKGRGVGKALIHKVYETGIANYGPGMDIFHVNPSRDALRMIRGLPREWNHVVVIDWSKKDYPVTIDGSPISPTASLTKTAQRFSPDQMMGWDEAKPWNGSREDYEYQRIDGWAWKSARGTEVASYEGGAIKVTEDFIALPEETRRAVAYHEAGHALLEQSGGLPALGRYMAANGDGDVFDLQFWPGGKSLSYNAEEIVAEAYSVMWTEPEWFDRMGAQSIAGLVEDFAKSEGWPLP